MVKDQVCGMEVDEKEAAANAEHEAKTYYFCSQGLEEKDHEDTEVLVARSHCYVTDASRCCADGPCLGRIIQAI